MNYFYKSTTVSCLSGFSVGQLCHFFFKNTSERHPLCFQFGVYQWGEKYSVSVMSILVKGTTMHFDFCFCLFFNHKGRAFLLCCFLSNLQNNCKVLEWLQYPLQHECFSSSREMPTVSLGWLSDRLLIENSWFFFFFFLTEQLWLPVINLLGYSSKYAKLQVPASFETVWGMNADPRLGFVCHQIAYLVYNYLAYPLTSVFSLMCAYLLRELDPVWERCKTASGLGV